MVLVGGLGGGVLNTVLLGAFLLAVGQFNIGDVVQVARPLLIGDTIGIAVVTPLLLRFRVRERLQTHRLLSLAPERDLYLFLHYVAHWLVTVPHDAHRLIRLTLLAVT